MGRVIIVGAGPTGLWLAAELALAGTDVTVLERRAERDLHSKGFTIQPRTLELWASRGIADRFLDAGRRVPTSHFALLDQRMDYGVLDTPFPFVLILGQPDVEAMLEDHARAAGADIRRGHSFLSSTQRADDVTARIAGPNHAYELQGAFLVGCDGVRSSVRAAAGIGFPGTDGTALSWVADVRLDAPPNDPYYQATSPAGSLLVVPLGPTLHRVAGIEPKTADPEPATTAALAAKVKAIAGTDFGLRDSFWSSRSDTDNRLAETYRAGRILLAGDAAHRIAPAGGRGLNTGVQDAANLGWKLAAVVRGQASDEFLDSYHDERHAVGVELMDSIRAQMPLMNRFDEETLALRSMLTTMIAEIPEVSRRLAAMTSGLDVTYRPPSPQAHPLAGRRAPNLLLDDGRTLFDRLTPARYQLLDLTGHAVLTSMTESSDARATAPAGARAAEWRDVRGALIRPDGHVAWASDAEKDSTLRSAAKAALNSAWR
ncbi:NAD(P)-binding protein [Actinoplanes sp. TBRC 11911]|uniref:FAD-dependent oxidoreductase n=1 Tax=Actinoplanes sp. TBRC 11911 TaxID=2729386 RepID=UPI00145DE486|nr:FAD-dependent oxidoreductase [Actinoplanes sp. TBRC 11911]NMO53682.1 NAD(P)-binding protein [Actinoplanes sp. TBRC 11911]